ncbi:YqaA family protein [Neptunicoccus cionae]|uniref:YqaA family protein n=1 Tax=Neptunicoccus cionae TaxID=2035344 RepID=UPI000C78A6D7|nr:VTT domain-containing protein [Amylibacter cionae]PLS22530.1 cytochrome B [Amylibacter cionae]
MLRRFYEWILSLAQSRWALAALAIIAFVESSVFPIPPDVLLIPLILAAPTRAFMIAAVCTVSSVLGGAFGYYIGAELFDAIGRPILDFYHKAEAFETFKTRFNEQGHWAVLFAGITPFPYKVITITSGATDLPFWSFLFWSLIARGIRFFIVATLLWHFGAPIRDFIERRLALVFTVFLILLVLGFWAVKYF